MQKLKLQFKMQKLLVFFIFSFVFVPSFVYGAIMSFNPSDMEVQEKQIFSAEVLVNSENNSINAFAGKIQFPAEILEFYDWSDGNSIINLWIERPIVKDNIISFSGIVPGGYQGEKGLLLTLRFRATKPGNGTVFFLDSSQMLLNDGLGTSVNFNRRNLEISVRRLEVSTEIPPTLTVKDAYPPESFVPKIARNELMFDGKWFLVFTTQDKKSGIDYYEVREIRQWIKIENLLPFVKYLRRYSWIIAESPYILQDQELRSFIYIKAVDNAGNERIAVIEPRYPLKWYEMYGIWVILVILIVIVGIVLYFGRKFLWKLKAEERR